MREVTPTGLIANAQYAVAAPQQRFYSGGPTDVLRIVSDLDQRVLGFDTDPSAHECLTAQPVAVSYALPAGQSFSAKLQCLQTFPAGPVGGAGWMAFGFDQAAADVDAGPVVASEGNDF